MKNKKLKNWGLLIVVFSLMFAMSVDAENVTIYSDERVAVKSSAMTTPLSTTTIQLCGTDPGFIFLTYDLSGIDCEDVVSAELQIDGHWDSPTGVNVYNITSPWNSEDGTYAVDEEPVATAATYFGLRQVMVDLTDYVKNTASQDKLSVMLSSVDRSSTKGALVYLSNDNLKLNVKLDEAPTIERIELTGNAVEGFGVNVSYDYNHDTYSDASEIEWLCAEDASGNGEYVISEGTDKNFLITSEYVDKYIRAKVTAYASDGKFKKDGSGTPNEYYTEYIGPIKSVSYLDELVLEIQGVETPDDLYIYLQNNEEMFKLGLSELNAYADKKEQLLSNILADLPACYQDLKKIFVKELGVIKIEKADEGEIAALIEDSELGLELTCYYALSNKGPVYSCLVNETITGYADLQSKLDQAVLTARFLEETSAAAFSNLISANASVLDVDIDGLSYGELICAGEYIAECDKTGITDFDTLKDLVGTAVIKGRQNYTGGYISQRKNFIDEVCIKSDFSSNAEGVNSVVGKTDKYALFGIKNGAEYTSELFLKLDLTEVLSNYSLYAANLKMYGTIGGGANVMFEVVEAPAFESSESFLKQYPFRSDINSGAVIGEFRHSYGTTKWTSTDITSAVKEKIAAGEKYLYLMIVTNNAAGADISKAGTIRGLSAGEFSPYVELVYETPPMVKNIVITGIKGLNNTIAAEYDYYGCYDEANTIYDWYCADKSGENYVNVAKVSQPNSPYLFLDGNMVGKYIMVNIKPCSSNGTYKEGEYTASKYTERILSSSECTVLVNNINSADSVSAMRAVLTDSDNMAYLYVDMNVDMAAISSSGAENVLQILADINFESLSEFKAYYLQMIDVQKINETEYGSLDDVMQKANVGVSVDRYRTFKDKTSVLTAIYNKDFGSVQAFQTAFNEACAVYEFSTVSHSNAAELLIAYDFMFEQELSKYSESELSLICNMFMTSIQGNKASFDSIQRALTTAINNSEQYTPGIDPSSGSGSSSSGGGRGGFSSVSVPSAGSVSQQLTPVTPLKIFNDLDSVASWAEESILFLHDKGIIAGDGNGMFRPNDSITREEFVKMVVSSFDVTGKDECSFDDVDRNAWYCEYVDKAVSAGIINGVGDGKFGAGSNITREDMASIIYRVLLGKSFISENSADMVFDDSEEIASYAYSAVSTLTDAGIIKGVGENKFAPKENATRAMAAVMICNALNIQQ